MKKRLRCRFAASLRGGRWWVRAGTRLQGGISSSRALEVGVALMVLAFGVAMGCNVYVTSGDQGKVERAVKLGAKGGVVSYREEGWEKKVKEMLPE